MPAVMEHELGASELSRLASEYESDAVTITDSDLDAPDGPTILYVNPAFELVSGHSAGVIVGRRLGFLYSGAMLAETVAQMRDAVAARRDTEVHRHVHRRDGKVAWYSGKIAPVLSPSGRLMCLVRVTRDITSQKRAEQELRVAQRLLGSIFSVVDQGLGVVDDSGRIVMGNQGFWQALGAGPDDMRGQPFADLLTPAAVQAVEALRRDASAKSTMERLAVHLRRPGREPVEAHVVPNAVDQQRCYLVVACGATAVAAAPPERPAARPAPAAHAAAGESAPAARPPEFGSAVRDVLASSGKEPAKVVAGKLQLIGLDEVRRALGDRWPELETKIFAAAEAILRRHVGPRDAFSRTLDDGFLVCFADLSEEEGAFKAQALRREICDRLIGQSQELLEAKVTAHVAEVPVSQGETATDVSIADAVERRLKGDRERREAAVRKSLWDEITPGRIRLDKVRTSAGQPAPVLRARLPAELEIAIENMDPSHEIGLAYEAGILLLTAVAERLMSDQLSASQELVVTPVHISTLLEKRSREEWIKVARGIDIVGKARLVLEIHGLSKDIGQARLAEIITRCAPLFRAIAIELPECETPLINDLPPSVRILTLPARRAFAGPVLSTAFGRLMRTGGMRMRQLMIKDLAHPADAVLFANAGVALIASHDSV